jgi:hypothetical protein
MTIALTKVPAADNRAAKPVPPHFMKPFFARQARRLNQANSVAMMINVARASKSRMVHPEIEQEKLERISRGRPRQAPAVPTETYSQRNTGRLRYRAC